MRSLCKSIALLALSWQVAAEYPDPLSCSGVCNNTHDPALIQRASDGIWFRFSTGNKLSIHSASSETGPWEYKGFVLSNCSVIQVDGNCDLWAPDVTKVGNTYYLYYSVSVSGSQTSAIGVATSTELDVGTWTDHGSTGLESDPTKPYNTIDGTLLIDGNNYILTFGSFWNDIYNVQLQDPLLSIVSDASVNHLALNATGTHSLEGSYLFHYQQYYYLFFSSGICCGYVDSLPAAGEEYKIMVCRSETATGGFVDANGVDCLKNGGTEVLASHGFVYGPGGQGVYATPDLGPVLYYHYVDTRVGYADGAKLLGINPIDFSSGWPVLSSAMLSRS
jgi:arabinan endo-1,5-alpha-L-arabinosidase